MSTIVYRPVDYKSNNDRARVLSLYRDIFHVDFAEDYDMWFCDEDRRSLGIAAIDEESGDMVGHWACVRFHAVIAGEATPFRLSLGTMTALAYRGNGIATGLFRNLQRAILKENDALFFMGFPNEMSYKLLVQLGFVPYRDYHFVVFPKGKTKSAYVKKDVSVLKNQIAPFSETNQLCHSDKYMSWRFRNEKYNIWQSDIGHIFISTRFMDKADILYWSEDAGSEELLDFAAFLYAAQDIKKVTTWNSAPYLDTLPREDRNYHMCVNHLNCGPEERAKIQKNWFFCMGDCELF